jgi:hypothetical protein
MQTDMAAELGSFHRGRILAAHLLYLAAVIAHVADHVVRGTASLPVLVFWGGIVLAIFQFGSLVFTIPGHRLAPFAAMYVGFGTAIATSASHLAPHWSALSNPYPGQSLSGWSWAAMLSEIVTGLILGTVGFVEFRRQNAGVAVGVA